MTMILMNSTTAAKRCQSITSVNDERLDTKHIMHFRLSSSEPQVSSIAHCSLHSIPRLPLA